MTGQSHNEFVYVLIHSPLVGPLTWSLVADQLEQSSLIVIPVLEDSPASNKPFWKQHAESVSRSLVNIPREHLIVLVAHSGASPLLPCIAQSLSHKVHAYIFVDAGIPQNNLSRLELMKLEDSEWGKQFEHELEQGGSFPNWTSEDLREIIPDDSLLDQLVAEIHPHGMDFFKEPIPVFKEWPDALCAYIRFSDAYKFHEAYARNAKWRTFKLAAGHFHMLVDPKSVADLLIKAMN